jgi:hypothetical protein
MFHENVLTFSEGWKPHKTIFVVEEILQHSVITSYYQITCFDAYLNTYLILFAT